MGELQQNGIIGRHRFIGIGKAYAKQAQISTAV